MVNKGFRRALVLGGLPALCLAAGFGLGVAAGARWFDAPAAAAQERTPIRVTRIYTGEDGKTHAEEYDVPLTSARGATELSDPVAVTSVQFRRTSSDDFIDWHTAPRRQYVITLAGESEVECALTTADSQEVASGLFHIVYERRRSTHGKCTRVPPENSRGS